MKKKRLSVRTKEAKEKIKTYIGIFAAHIITIVCVLSRERVGREGNGGEEGRGRKQEGEQE